MAVLKCKMCGGTLEITEGMTVCECEYCGTQQTITTAKDENLQALFNRANILRMKSEFDKAEQLYEKLVQSSPDDAEAHWGLILCKYGIEYVEDPATFKRVPTCHRTSFDSIIADEDYKEALRCADVIQRGIYEAEAKEIDRLQKEILALSAKEDPYDVFICYKESDNGSRTPDSVIANDIYHQLTNEGFKVFYAAITLEDKLGSAYEPCIFAALNSAKVMLAIGTRPEYFNAVWVKNEWSRYLKMMKKDRSKLLIPCYKDMDAYELPEEFAHLQAQDMSKIGFINDIVRGIKKVIVKDEPKTAGTQTAVNESVPAGNPTANSLVKRAFIFLEDGEWQSADEYCEKALDIDPENAQAYLGKLMVELKVNKREELKNCTQSFDNSGNYQKVMRYGDNNLKKELSGITEKINILQKNTEIESCYSRAITSFAHHPFDINILKSTREDLISILGYKNTSELLEKIDKKIKKIEERDKNVTPIENFTYTVDNGGIIITNYIGNSKTVVMPMIIENMPVYQIGSNSFFHKDINAVDIPDTVSVISTSAFEGCYNLRQVTLSRNIQIIKAKAFYFTDMTEIDIPQKVEIIEDNAFAGCNNLKKLIIPEKTKKLGDYAFSYCETLNSVTILGKIKTIPIGAFFRCKSLSEVALPDTLSKIDYSAFSECVNLQSINIPDSVVEIDSTAFKKCSNLKSITGNSAVFYKSQDRCQHCGGKFKGLFSKKCLSCGREKDY